MVATSAIVLVRMQRSGIAAVAPLMGLGALQDILFTASTTVSEVSPPLNTAASLTMYLVQHGHHG